MKAAQEIIARIFAQRGFVEHVRQVGVYDVKTEANDLTDSQAALIHVCVRDDKMLALIGEVFDNYEKLKAENDLDAEPWYGDISA